MYYIVYVPLYLISLLPFFILYRISDFAFFIIYYIGGYRKEIVMGNLEIAFPEKSLAEKKDIAKKFYKNLTDSFIETIKLLSMTKRNFYRRATMDLSKSKELLDKGKSILFCLGHQMNWEYGNRLMSENLTVKWIGIYMKIKNRAVEELFYKLRTKQGAVLIAAQEFKSRREELFKDQYSLGLVADQNPGIPGTAYWLYFFNQPAPFVTGPDKWATKSNASVVFAKLVKTSRGHYQFVADIIKENGADLQPGELTLLYRDYLEATIKENPDNYLWSHRRWKWEYQMDYEKRWIDRVAPPK